MWLGVQVPQRAFRSDAVTTATQVIVTKTTTAKLNPRTLVFCVGRS